MASLLRPSSVLYVTLACSAAACATGGGLQVSDITPAQISSLEAERGQRPQDAGTLAKLGVAYFKAERYTDARPVLDSAVAHDPGNGVAAIYLGMTAEQTGDFAAAKAAYQAYVGLARSADLKAVAQQRLALVGRRQLEYEARAALANEAALAAMPPESNTVAVMPFDYGGGSADIRALTRGFAQLLVTDLAQSRQLRVLERERMQAMLDEIRLADSGKVDTMTAVRSGHMLRAARVVQGTLTDLPSDQLRVNAVVVDVATAGAGATASGADRLSRLFDLEKQIAFSIFNAMGVQLAPDEQAAVNQRPTQNIQAFLAYSRGLMAQDTGNFAAAQAEFNDAVNLDPGFRAAGQGAATASDLATATQSSLTQTAQVVSSGEQLPPPPPAGPDVTQTALQNGTDGTNPSSGSVTAGENGGTQGTQTQGTQQTGTKNNTSEILNGQGAAPPSGTVVIIIKRP